MKLCLRIGSMAVSACCSLLFAVPGSDFPVPDSTSASSEAPLALPAAPAPTGDPRILGLIPDYQTVRDSSAPVPPLTERQKWQLGLKEAVDPFNVGNALLTAAFSQHGNQTPRYGEGWDNYGRRVGAAIADF